jgi:hypothetical protein
MPASRSQVGEQRRLAINGEVAGSPAPKGLGLRQTWREDRLFPQYVG